MSTLIGITTYGRDGQGSFSLPAEYVDAVRRGGGSPTLLTPGGGISEGIVERLDGLILAGGGDVDSRRYGQSRHEQVYMVDEDRDESEVALANWAVRNELPTLAICRGIQVVNVALGGSLIQHLPEAVGRHIAHRIPPRRPAWHPIKITSGSRLGRLLGCSGISPASWHHQAVDRVGDGLTVVARAEDGTVEALEMPRHRWLLAVQWHPELTAAYDVTQQALFDGLVAAAGEDGKWN